MAARCHRDRADDARTDEEPLRVVPGSGAMVSRATVSRAKLIGAIVSRATLRRAVVSRAMASRATLTRAMVSRGAVSRAMVRRATARSAPYLTKAIPTTASPRRAEEGQAQREREQGGGQPGELVRC